VNHKNRRKGRLNLKVLPQNRTLLKLVKEKNLKHPSSRKVNNLLKSIKERKKRRDLKDLIKIRRTAKKRKMDRRKNRRRRGNQISST